DQEALQWLQTLGRNNAQDEHCHQGFSDATMSKSSATHTCCHDALTQCGLVHIEPGKHRPSSSRCFLQAFCHSQEDPIAALYKCRCTGLREVVQPYPPLDQEPTYPDQHILRVSFGSMDRSLQDSALSLISYRQQKSQVKAHVKAQPSKEFRQTCKMLYKAYIVHFNTLVQLTHNKKKPVKRELAAAEKEVIQCFKGSCYHGDFLSVGQIRAYTGGSCPLPLLSQDWSLKSKTAAAEHNGP
ncbi:hypothetical protein STEG23_033231, partial [Scotinomys teguina]